MKKNLLFTVAALMVGTTLLTACGSGTAETSKTTEAGTEAATEAGAEAEVKGASGDITIVSREDGSGTRGAFVELLGIEVKDADGNKVDMTTVDAKITNSTSVMMTTVEGDVNAIGYISLGSLNDTVTAVKVDGVEATAENVKAGTYTVQRPFNIATKDDVSEVAQDFINYILSAEGQAIIEEAGYIMIDDAAIAFETNGAEGKVVVAGSSSVTPVMEKLKEAYAAVNANVTVEINTSDSSTGVSSAIEGTCDIGMASRALKDTETAEGVEEVTIAKDGIAVIVNNNNPVEDLTTEAVKNIYVGDILTWSEI